jgi:hypothetical protein
MSKRLLRKLLSKESDKTSTSNVSDDIQNLKYAQYYSTDKSRNVITKIPSKMSIYKPTSISNMSNTFSDDLSDIDSKLLTHINSKDKPVTYYSTDKQKYTTTFIPRKVDVINDLSDLSSKSIIDLYDKLQNDESDGLDSSTFLYDGDRKKSYRYSDESSDKDSYISEPSSIYSQDLSNKSSYNSDLDTSYDSFYDDSAFYNNSVRQKDNYFDTRVKKYDLEDLLDL